MKKIAVTGALVLLCLVMSGCSNRENRMENEQDSTQSMAASQVQESTEDAGLQEGAQGTESKPVSPVSDGQVREDWTQELENARAAVKEVMGEQYWPDIAVEWDLLEQRTGLSSELYEGILAEASEDTLSGDVFLMVRAKEEQVDAVAKVLEDYREILLKEAEGSPADAGKAQASRIEKIGNYVCFIQLGADVEDWAKQGRESVMDHCLEQNELAIEVIRNTVVK